MLKKNLFFADIGVYTAVFHLYLNIRLWKLFFGVSTTEWSDTNGKRHSGVLLVARLYVKELRMYPAGLPAVTLDVTLGHVLCG